MSVMQWFAIICWCVVIVASLLTIHWSRQATRNWRIAEENWKKAEEHWRSAAESYRTAAEYRRRMR